MQKSRLVVSDILVPPANDQDPTGKIQFIMTALLKKGPIETVLI